jgi:hypothetical protein
MISLGVKMVQLDDHFLRAAEERWRSSDRSGERDLSVRRDVAGLDHGPVELTEETAAHLLGQVREVHVEEAGLAGVDALPQRLVALVGRPPGNGVGPGEFAVEGIAGGRARDHRDLEGPAGGVFGAGPGRQRLGRDLGGARGGETAKTDRLAVRDERRRFIGSQHRKADTGQ